MQRSRGGGGESADIADRLGGVIIHLSG